MVSHHMTLDEFWSHIQASKRSDPDEHVEKLIERLAKLEPAEIIDFDHWWYLKLREASRWNLWGAAYLINGGCSDDGFEYFRDWLILQGRDVFQAAVANPDTLAEVVDPDDEYLECECYPGLDAWFEATATMKDDTGYKALQAAREAHPDRPSGEPDMGENWDFDDDAENRKRLPRLAAMYLNREA
jgi:hypothetical protein